METSLFFMDECIDDSKSVLTGVLVPIEELNAVRADLYTILKGRIEPQPGMINVSPPELHGSKMLVRVADATDDERIRCFDGVVACVLKRKLPVYRIGYRRSPQVRAMFTGDEGLRGLCWLGLLTVLQTELARRFVIPVMDLVDQKDRPKYSQVVRTLDVIRSTGRDDYLSLTNSENLYGDVLYADSQFSILTQMADVVSHLRHVTDDGEKPDRTEFKRRLYEIGRKLDATMTSEKLISLQTN